MSTPKGLTITWRGSFFRRRGVWSNPRNWRPRIVPGPNDNVILNRGTVDTEGRICNVRSMTIIRRRR